MIETLSLRNFKVLRSVDVRLRPLTLIVGPNSSGKSTLLEALYYGVHHLVLNSTSSIRPDLGRPRWPVHSNLSDARSRVSHGPVLVTISARGKSLYTLNLNEEWRDQFTGDRSALGNEGFFPATLDLDAKNLAEPSPAREVVKTLPPDGSGLAWILAGLHLEARGQFDKVVERLSAVVPAVKGLRIRPTTLQFPKEVGYELLFDMKGGEGIPAGDVSEGTLVTLALLVALASPDPPSLVLIENLDRGLHPRAFQDLVRQIRMLQEQNPRLQVIATSHSPYLLDFVEADEILLTSLDEDGYASVKPLSEHPEYDRWKDVMAPGEFWSTVGESWVVQKT